MPNVASPLSLQEEPRRAATFAEAAFAAVLPTQKRSALVLRDLLLVALRGRHAKRLFAILIPILSGCVSLQAPKAIREAPNKAVSVSQVQQEPERFLDRRVRWGGTIIAVRNRKRTTEIEVLSRPLSSRGEPWEEESGDGRFIARLVGFADPAEYPEKRLLTVTGRIVRVQTRLVGEYPYRYPVVAVEQSYLWPEPPSPHPLYYYPDPWFYPWYPWGWL